MSGGAFDYEDQRISILVENIQNIIEDEGVEGNNSLRYAEHQMLNDISKSLEEIQSRLHHLDFALSGDISMTTALNRILEEAKK